MEFLQELESEIYSRKAPIPALLKMMLLAIRLDAIDEFCFARKLCNAMWRGGGGGIDCVDCAVRDRRALKTNKGGEGRGRGIVIGEEDEADEVEEQRRIR